MASLPDTAHQHHGRIAAQVDRLPGLADMIPAETSSAAFVTGFTEVHGFLVDQLVPHMEAAEASFYPQLERLMQNRHSMTPMKHEHEEVRELLLSLGTYRDHVERRTLGHGEGMGLRRVLLRLYTILKVHLAEEEEYLGVLRHNLSSEEQEVLARGIEHAAAQPL